MGLSGWFCICNPSRRPDGKEYFNPAVPTHSLPYFPSSMYVNLSTPTNNSGPADGFSWNFVWTLSLETTPFLKKIPIINTTSITSVDAPPAPFYVRNEDTIEIIIRLNSQRKLQNLTQTPYTPTFLFWSKNNNCSSNSSKRRPCCAGSSFRRLSN